MKPDKPVEKLQLINKEIDVSDSIVLFNHPITAENLKTLFEIHNSEWSVENGWLTGRNPDESQGWLFGNKIFQEIFCLNLKAGLFYPLPMILTSCGTLNGAIC